MSEYRTVSLPSVLLDELLQVGDRANMGYRSTAEAVADSVRYRILELKIKEAQKKSHTAQLAGGAQE